MKQDHFNILRKIHKNPRVSQREMSKDLNLSLGKLNYCVRAPVAAKEHMVKNKIEHMTLFEVAKDFHLLRYLSNVNNKKKNKVKKNLKYYLYRIKRSIQRSFSV